jgi:hypothetical protein
VAHFVHFFRPSLVLLNLSYRDLSNNTDDVIIRVSMCLRGLFIYFFTFFSIFSLHKLNEGERREERGEREKTKKENNHGGTLVLLEKSRRDESNNTKECHNTSRPKVSSSLAFKLLIWPTSVIVVTFLGVVRFVLSRSFQRY